MIRFECDYAEGCHPALLDALQKTNMEQHPGYSEDAHCDNARRLIKEKLQCEEADVHFLVGGTQTNATVICAALRPHQGVVAAVTGHINVHESGAIEALGHKVLPLPSSDGRISAQQVEKYCADHFADATHEHMVQPGMVYISQPTENGTLYTLAELEELRRVCDKFDMMLYVDGARCGYGLAAPGNDVFLPDLVRLTDAFYIGGTKVGALFGEALVIRNGALKKDFRYFIKRQGGMLAKGRLLGVQFETLMQNGLYEEISAHAVELALQIRKAFEDCGVKMLYQSMTNQQFPVLTKAQQAAFREKYAFSHWEKVSETEDAVRFCTSWATEESNVKMLLEDIRTILG